MLRSSWIGAGCLWLVALLPMSLLSGCTARQEIMIPRDEAVQTLKLDKAEAVKPDDLRFRGD